MNINKTPIDGLVVVDMEVHADDRGSFCEAWQAAKLQQLGFTDFSPVQMNVSQSKQRVLRGIHAEPWDKYIFVPYGEVFAAIVDLRTGGDSFGRAEKFILDGQQALFVPQGLGNSFQVLSEHAAYSYLVTDHWRPGLTYQAVAYDDPDLAIEWPLAEPLLSDKDQANPTMRELFPERFTT